MKKTTIYLIRHGEVQNPDHIIYGRLPHFDLSARGRFQGAEIGKWLSGKHLALVVSSPLLRARKTAQLISRGKIPIRITEAVNEADYKKWEGKKADCRPIAELESYVKTPDAMDLGETLSMVEKRMKKAINGLVSKYPGKSIAVVSHADPILTARLSYEGKSLGGISRCTIKNASVTTLEFDEQGNFLESEYHEIVEARKDMP